MTDAMRFRAMSEADLPAAHGLSAGLGWPHRPEDWRVFHDIGRGTVAEDAQGRVRASGLWWPFGDGLATIGMVIVEPGLQGRGLGRRLMETLVAEAGGRAIGLTATPAGRPLYESLGFRVTGANGQHHGIARARAGAADAGIRAAEAGDWPAMAELDAEATGADRGALLGALRRAGTATVLERGGRIRGYAACRPFGRGRVVGPIVCADDAEAVALARPHLEAHDGTFLRVDTPRREGPFVAFLEAAGLANVDRSVVMTRGHRAAPGAVSVLALAAQALG